MLTCSGGHWYRSQKCAFMHWRLSRMRTTHALEIGDLIYEAWKRCPALVSDSRSLNPWNKSHAFSKSLCSYVFIAKTSSHHRGKEEHKMANITLVCTSSTRLSCLLWAWMSHRGVHSAQRPCSVSLLRRKPCISEMFACFDTSSKSTLWSGAQDHISCEHNTKHHLIMTLLWV